MHFCSITNFNQSLEYFIIKDFKGISIQISLKTEKSHGKANNES